MNKFVCLRTFKNVHILTKISLPLRRLPVFWSHLHPALIHFVIGLGSFVLAWDVWRLQNASASEPETLPFGLVLEVWGGLLLLGVGTGWIALVHDTLVQNGGASIPLGQIHGKMGVFFLFLASLRILGGGNPATLRLRRLWIGVDLALLLLLFGTALLGERLVFHQGLGLSNLFTSS